MWTTPVAERAKPPDDCVNMRVTLAELDCAEELNAPKIIRRPALSSRPPDLPSGRCIFMYVPSIYGPRSADRANTKRERRGPSQRGRARGGAVLKIYWYDTGI